MNRGKSKHRPRNDPKLFGGDYPFVQTGDIATSGLFLDKYTQTLSNFGLAQSKLWKKGTLAITIAANVADSTILKIDAAFPDSVIGFETDTSSILFDKFLLDNMSQELKRTAPTGSQANLNLAILSKTSEFVPSKIEQEKIGKLLSEFETVIDLHERKLNSLKQLKKAYLQQLFPENGKKIPSLRFAGFADDWEQRKLLTLVQRVSKQSENLSIPSVEYEDIQAGTGTLNKDITQKKVHKRGIQFHNNDILFGKLRPYLDNRLHSTFTGIAVGDFWVLRPTLAISSFVYALIQADHFQTLANQTSGTKMPRSDWSKVSDEEYLVPAQANEQSKMGTLFDSLDRTIALHQRKLETFRNLKKAYLQKLFV